MYPINEQEALDMAKRGGANEEAIKNLVILVNEAFFAGMKAAKAEMEKGGAVNG